jgi:DNA-binding transcriptional MerR regulator
MKYLLSGIKLDEVSLVDIPAAPMAKIALFKRGDMDDEMKAKMKEYMDKGYSEDEARAMMKKEDGMDPEELAKRLEELEGQVAEMTGELDTLKKAADEAGFDFDGTTLTKRAPVEYIEVEGEKIAKSAIPAVILKALEAKEAELAVAKAKEAEAAIAKRGAEVLPNLSGTDLVKGKLLEAIGDDEELLKSLKAADAAIAKAMEEVGFNPMNEDASAAFRLNKMAGEYAEAHKVPFETAYAEVTKSGEGRDLMVQARNEGK